MTVSHDGESSEHLHRINIRFYEFLPGHEKSVIVAQNTSKKELKFEEPHGGRIIIATAGKKSGGHSYTLRQLHLSEGPRWPDGSEDTVIGLLNSVSESPDTIIIDEGVANGMSGRFYNEWYKPDSAFAKVFLSWADHKEYQMPVPGHRGQYENSLSPEELQLVSKYKLSLEQLEWRRHTIRNKCKEDTNIFREQYPLTPDEAFRTSGRSFFNIDALLRQDVTEPIVGNLQMHEVLGHKKELTFAPNQYGYASLYKRPQKGRSYVIGADVAAGIEVEGGSGENRYDYSSADVIDRDTGEQVYHWHGQVTPDEFGRQLVLIGQWYNMAFQCPENNGGYGQHVITEIINQGYPEYLVFQSPNQPKGHLGFVTSKRTKKPLCSGLDMSIRMNEIFIRHQPTIEELKAFENKKDGAIAAGSGKHDDRVISLAIAVEMLKFAPIFQAKPQDTAQIITGQPLVIEKYNHNSIYRR